MTETAYLLVVDGEEAEHGAIHGTGSTKATQSPHMVGHHMAVRRKSQLLSLV